MQRVLIPNVRQDERIGSSFNHIIQVVDLTERASSDTPDRNAVTHDAQTQPDRNADNHDTQTQPDRNAVTLSIAVGRNDLRTASAKEKRTPAGCPTTHMGDPSWVDIPSTILPGVLRTPRLLKGGRFHRPDAVTHDAQTQPDRNADNHDAQTQTDRNAVTHDAQTQPDRNAVTLSIAVGSQNLRTQRKDRWQAPRQGAPLNSRGSERPADSKRKGKCTPAGCPNS